jgi:hypothetical protein
MGVPEISRESREPLLDMEPLPVPVDEGSDGEGVAKIMDAGAPGRAVGQSSLVHETEEGAVDVLVDQASGGEGDEEGWAS